MNLDLANAQQEKNMRLEDKASTKGNTNDNSSITELTDEEIDRQISKGLERANKLTGILEQYKPNSNYYRTISDELEGRKVTLNGLKYPFEITEKDLFFVEPVNSELSGEIPNTDSTN